MEYIVKGFKPENLFRYFEEICAIPHGSGDERRIAEYIENFARERGLYVIRDSVNNVFVRKNATEKYKNAAPILLQGHTDMVCEKNSDTVHDFLTDPLKLRLEGNFLTADGTTLGGDDGIAVAMMLALLDGTVLDEHPTLECLFTVEEEVGLLGAHSFDYSEITANKMINLDSECESEIIVGCAGGIRSDLTLNLHTEELCGEAIEIAVKGLSGGHSGEDIGKGRANANKLMARILAALSASAKLNIVSLNGGSKDNAIPRECTAVVAAESLSALTDALERVTDEICAELSTADAGFELIVKCVDAPERMFSDSDTAAIISLMNEARNGVLAMSEDIEGLVEYSRNFGILETREGEMHFTFSSRSANDSQIDASIEELDMLAKKFGGSARHYSRYPGWSYQRESELREKYIEIYRAEKGEEVNVRVIHAGLECGVIKSKKPNMDIISIGPDMQGIHSPDEKLDLSSCERVFSMLTKLISEA